MNMMMMMMMMMMMEILQIVEVEIRARVVPIQRLLTLH
jgi:hypothetical protein